MHATFEWTHPRVGFREGTGLNHKLADRWHTFSCRDGFEMRYWCVRPETTSPLPGVLFVYEPFGVNAEMQRVASAVAHAGYVVMIPDLMQRGSFFSCMRRLMADLKSERGRGVDDLLDARTALAARPDVLPDRVAVMGLCMGGGFALILAKTGLFRVSAPFYGQVPQSIAGSCPIIASYGGRDAVTASAATRLGEALRGSAIEHDFKVYPGAGHSFMTRPPNRLVAILGPISPGHSGFNVEAAADATRRLLAFFQQHL
jgi:carboxymethylenebutenolidase